MSTTTHFYNGPNPDPKPTRNSEPRAENSAQREIVFDNKITIGGRKIDLPRTPVKPQDTTIEEIQDAVRKVLMRRRAQKTG